MKIRPKDYIDLCKDNDRLAGVIEDGYLVYSTDGVEPPTEDEKDLARRVLDRQTVSFEDELVRLLNIAFPRKDS